MWLNPADCRLVPDCGVNWITPWDELRSSRELVQFSTAAGTPICADTTNRDGVARCNGRARSDEISAGGGYVASYDGDAEHGASSDTGVLVMEGTGKH